MDGRVTGVVGRVDADVILQHFLTQPLEELLVVVARRQVAGRLPRVHAVDVRRLPRDHELLLGTSVPDEPLGALGVAVLQRVGCTS